ncbi:MAG: hypothetical protein ACLS7Q_00215 [Varibaculum cambriense]
MMEHDIVDSARMKIAGSKRIPPTTPAPTKGDADESQGQGV